MKRHQRPFLHLGATMFLSCRAMVYLLCTLAAYAHAQTFESITIKPARSSDRRNERVRVLPNGDLIAHSVPLISLLSYAYDLPANPSPRLSSLPDWTFGDMYDIEAKNPANSAIASPIDSEEQIRAKLMIRRLLASRFNLALRVEQVRMPAYALTITGGGLKLQKSGVTTRDCILDTAPEGCHSFVIGFGHPLNANAVSMNDLAHYIENWTDLPVIDRTGLSGLFTAHTEGWLPMRLPPPPPNGNANVDFASLPTLFTVLSKLGLALHRQSETLPVYTVERIERPSVN